MNILNKDDLFDILGVSRDCNATDLKKAYRKLALKYHPDKNSSPEAEEVFKKVNSAFACLSDETKRASYERWGHTDGAAGVAARGGPKELSPEHIRNYFFDGNGTLRSRGPPPSPLPASLQGLAKHFRLLPIIVIVILAILVKPPAPPWSRLSPNSEFCVRRRLTPEWLVADDQTHEEAGSGGGEQASEAGEMYSWTSYWVRPSFAAQFGQDARALHQAERQVVDALRNSLSAECTTAQRAQQQQLARKAKQERAARARLSAKQGNINTPTRKGPVPPISCSRFHRLRTIL